MAKKRPAKKRPSPAARKKSADPPAAKRARGRPARAAAPIGPAEQELIGRLYLQQRSFREIAAVLDCDESTVRHHLAQHIRPIWRYQCGIGVEQELARADLLERIAWEQFELAIRRKSESSVKRELAPMLSDDAPLGAAPQVEKLITQTKFKKVGAQFWIQCIQWAMDFRCRLLGFYRVLKTGEGEVRVANRSRDDLRQALEERIREVLSRRQQRHKIEGRTVEGKVSKK